MRTVKIILYSALFLITVSCTGDFDEINTKQNGFESDELSAKFFITETQYQLYAPGRFEYWRAHLIHADRYAGHFTFGHDQSWWSDGLSYTYNAGYTDASWDWFSNYFGKVKNFLDLTKVGGNFENERMYATGLIIKSLYYQMYTDTFGMIPYSEAGVEGNLTPKYDTQKEIYTGIIADLDEAMAIIGSETSTGGLVEDLGDNDLYCGGDLQKWKKLANTLKLRIGMRALGATGENFATKTINEALGSPLLEVSVIMEKDTKIGQFGSAAYGDVWNNFGAGSDWTMGATLINTLKDNNDPRLAIYAAPAPGGEFVFEKSAANPDYQEQLDFIINTLDDANATYTKTIVGDKTTLVVDANQYIGQPTRLNDLIKPMVKYDMFSKPSSIIIQATGKGVPVYSEIIMSSAEAYFLKAEAAVRGIGNGNAQDLFESGIREAMKLWEVSSGQVDTYVMNEDAADISTGTLEEKLEKIATQRWLASYTDGFEAWAVVRDYGYPKELADGVSEPAIFELGTLNGKYPQRMRYGSGAQSNPNYTNAIATQGADNQGTKLWFAK
ncbi:SusD/RagB family nutrient-binding outer membrane lipoprotein [Polaribacter batillariae]|uniref:SusD/RagB family nutrient-binding outer membrane lipoprotein n=1 Tax=Polaribacter batillariae TaxID=2808900 RepID=A0ABX7SPU9_9FLAO|nr:SusD/RagB family nutrient-binding outer membrane lipoprotein [Polaribacter batillariae]QTD36245.1 SusD/RagB family nutrient-binding outer membrane lipoprotein [Polaribacter batillariae]